LFFGIGHGFGNEFIGHFFVAQGGVGLTPMNCGEEEEQLVELEVGMPAALRG